MYSWMQIRVLEKFDQKWFFQIPPYAGAADSEVVVVDGTAVARFLFLDVTGSKRENGKESEKGKVVSGEIFSYIKTQNYIYTQQFWLS